MKKTNNEIKHTAMVRQIKVAHNGNKCYNEKKGDYYEVYFVERKRLPCRT